MLRKFVRILFLRNNSKKSNKSFEIFKEWLDMTRPAPGPNGLRRPLWFKRAFTPDKSEGGCYYVGQG